MGRIDPANVAATNVKGGNPSQITVYFTGVMGAGFQNPVTYSGDTDALAPNPPAACPFPPASEGVTETTFSVATVPVAGNKCVYVTVQGPNVAKQTSFKVTPA